VAEYKSRRERRHAQVGKDGAGKSPAAIALIIGVSKKPKKKEGGSVEGEKARHHLGKRARGGAMPKRAEGGSTEAGQFSRWTTDELQNFLDTPTNPKVPFDKVLNQNIQNTIKARRQADKSGGAVEKRARGGATDEPRKTKQLDAREAALYSNGVDKVAEGSHREEREVPEEEREDGDDATNKVDDFYLKTWDGSINPKQMFLARPSKFGADADYRRADGGGVSAQNKGDLGPSRGKAPQYENDEDKDKRASGGRLTAHQRQKMPSSKFALPGKGTGPSGKGAGSYPIENPSHARNALARVAQHGSPEEQAKVRAAVHRRYPGIGKK
jgi:hypothetical protein